MSDLQKYVNKRKRADLEFAEGFEVGYAHFKVGVVLRQTREHIGLTQEQVASKLKINKSAIARIENHAEDMRLSTLARYAKALGKRLHVELLG